VVEGPSINMATMACMSTTRVAIYTRVSLDRNGDSESPERQEADCRSLAQQRGWKVVGGCAVRSNRSDPW
jgi:hypothetical protein